MKNLPLVRIEIELDRRKHGFGQATVRDYVKHSAHLQRQVDTLLKEKKPKFSGINPELLLKVTCSNNVGAEEFQNCGLEVIGKEDNNVLILFSTDAELQDFKSKLNAYKKGPQGKNKYPSYNKLFANIENISNLKPEDRIGSKLSAVKIKDSNFYWVDIELWHLGNLSLCRQKIDEIKKFISENKGKVTDDYIGNSIIVLRASVSGHLLKKLLNINYIREVDFPAQPSFNPFELAPLTIDSFPPALSPPSDSPGVCIIDSGIMPGHPLLAPAIGEAVSFPPELGEPNDLNGHGTKVAGIALYEDVLKCIEAKEFAPKAFLYSARVTNENNTFDNEKLITTQIRNAIKYFNSTYGCRIFNISLGDSIRPYQGGKQYVWAAVLDEIARELDVLIIVSAGNYYYDMHHSELENILNDYPKYLFEKEARIIDPASSAIAVTVGSICIEGGPTINIVAPGKGAHLRTIGKHNLPSPFTRTGPGVQNSIKPELCEYGGNQLYDGLTKRIREDRGLSIVTTSKDIPNQLFTTDVGTSFAAPVVACKAAQILRSIGYDISANLLRALLIHSAEYPNGIEDCFKDEEILYCYGYGVPNVNRVLESSDNRVTLFAEASIELDKFHIYEVPIPRQFNSVYGKKKITVTLAFDPPTRHTRNDYLGLNMSFRLIRGKSLDEVVNAFLPKKQVANGFSPQIPKANNCDMYPTPHWREKGTVQKAVFSAKKKLEYGDTYYLVVRCENKWVSFENIKQKYAVVLTIEHEDTEVKLYSEIEARINESIRISEKVRVKRVRLRR